MNVPLWVAEAAAGFWKEAGEEEAFPRRLLRPIHRSLPLRVIYQPRLTVGGVLVWLEQRGVSCRLAAPGRPLRACLVARGGRGFAFVDANDSPEEQRFSLAHELAHFLRDYQVPRRQAVRRLGKGVLEVCDGLRPPTPEEQLHAILGSIKIGFHTHLLARDAVAASYSAAERDADRFACELLAPAVAVLGMIRPQPAAPARAGVVAVLRKTFELPGAQAARYAALLLPSPPPGDPLLARLWSAPKK